MEFSMKNRKYICIFGFLGFLGLLNFSYSGQLVYSTFLGGNQDDIGYGIAVDSSGNAYITGRTDAYNFPTTSSAFDTSHNGGFKDVFVTKLNSTGTAILYSTYLGGNSDDQGNSISVDTSGN